MAPDGGVRRGPGRRGWRAAAWMLVWLVASGCAHPFGSRSPVEIRVANRTGVDLTSVMVTFPGRSVEYGPLPAGAVSAYERVDRAYRYARVEARGETETLLFQPEDYVGERLLGRGRYSLVLSVAEPSRQLVLTLERDGT